MDISMFAKEHMPGFRLKKDFDQEDSSACKPGDIIILRNASKFKYIWDDTYHAGVCCEDDEVIHLSDIRGGLIKAGTGNICRQHVNGFTHGKPFRILEKVDGIPPSFAKDVKRAMNSDKQHHKSKHNCIDFSLELIGINPEDYNKPCLTKCVEHQLPATSAPSTGGREDSTSDRDPLVPLSVQEEGPGEFERPGEPEQAPGLQEPFSSETEDSNEGSSENDDKTQLVPLPPAKVAEPQSPAEPEPAPVLQVEQGV